MDKFLSILNIFSYCIKGILPIIFIRNIIGKKKMLTTDNIILILSIVITSIILKDHPNISNIIYFIIVFIYLFINTSYKINIKLFIFIQFLGINISVAIIVSLLISYISGYNINFDQSHYNNIDIYIRILINLINYIVFVVLKKNEIFEEMLENKKIYSILFFTALINLLLITILSQDIAKGYDLYFSFIIRALAIFLLNLLFFKIINLLSIKHKNNYLLYLENDRLASQTKYINEIEETYKKIIEWKHDYNNHLNIITNLALNNKSEELSLYIKEVESRFLNSDIVCKSSNMIIDPLVNSKYIYAVSKEIKFDIKVGNIGDVNILDTDLCSIIGNLLDNSIEAALKSEEKYINLSILKVKKYLKIILYNTTNGVVIKKDDNYISTKETKGHGIGLKRIKNIVESYDGHIEISDEENIFKVKLFIPIDN